MLIKSVLRDGRVIFQDGKEVIVGIILHCTGYVMLPFLPLNTNIIIPFHQSFGTES